MEEARNKRQQLLLFLLLFAGYTLYTLTRQSLSYNIPNIKIYENVSSDQIGALTSAVAFGYAVGKFVSGVLVDYTSPRQLFAAGLFVCGMINLAFSFVSSMKILSILWLVNGLFQGFGWPSAVKLLRRWYSPGNLGTLWSILSASMNVAASVGPVISNILMDIFGLWRVSMRLYGLVAITFAGICFLLMRDFPNDNDLKDVHNSESSTSKPDDKIKKTMMPTLSSALGRILRSPIEYIMSLAFLGCLLCKGVMSDWVPIYLIKEKHASREMTLSFITAFQIGGFLGNISSGAITDWITAKCGVMKKGHPRNFLLIPLVALLIIFVGIISRFVHDMNDQYVLVLTCAFVIGYAVFSLISIIGVTVVEVSASDISGTSHAVAALFGNVGLILSGLPFTMIVGSFSWGVAFMCIEVVLLLWLLLAIFSHFIEYSIGKIKFKSE